MKYDAKIRLELCDRAAEDYRYLLGRGYRAAAALEFVGNHFQLRREERDFLMRTVCSREKAISRRKKRVPVEMISGQRLVIDGYNCLITLESAIEGRPLVQGDDCFVRDIARIFRKFRPSHMTRRAWFMISDLLGVHTPKFTFIFLDSKMSKSGELSLRINRWLSEAGITGRCATVSVSEKRMAILKGIKASADSVIIDSADLVFDLAGHIAISRLGASPLRLGGTAGC